MILIRKFTTSRLIFITLFFLAFASCLNAQSWKEPREMGSDYIKSNLTSVSFVSPDTGWVVGADGYILKTVNGGLDWTPQFTNSNYHLHDVCFASETHGWAVGGLGYLIATTDGGESWNVQTSNTSSSLLSIHFISPTTGWAVGEGGTILSTTNGGQNWTVQNSGMVNQINSVFFISPTEGWAVAVLGKVIHTTDGGITWTQQNTWISQTLNDVFFISPTQGWVVGASGKILTTSNGGTNWSQQTSPLMQDFFGVHFTSPTDGWVVGTTLTSLKTNDGGLSWNNVPQEYGGAVIYEVYFSSASTGYLISGNGKIRGTNDGGVTWETLNSVGPGVISDISILSDNEIWLTGGMGIYKSSNGGVNWSNQYLSNSEYLNGSDFVSNQTGWVVGSGGLVLKTTDGGTNWQQQYSGTSAVLKNVAFKTQNKGWVVGSNGTILTTSNSGTDWTPQNSGTTQVLASVCFVDENLGWAVGANGTILNTQNGGVTWTGQTSGTTFSLNSVFFTSSTVGYAVGAGGVILTTNDAGATWQPIVSGVSTDLNSICFIDQQYGWIAGNSGVLLKTTDGGTSWNSDVSNTTSHLMAVNFHSQSNGWTGGYLGVLMFYDCRPAAPVSNDQSFCSNSMIADLVASGVQGGTFNWYDAVNSSVPLPANQQLQSGIYYVAQELNGCESAERLPINVQIDYSTSQFTQTAYGSFDFNGTNYVTSGIYQDTLPGANINGCDSIITLDLTILPDLPLSVNTFSIPSSADTCVGGLALDAFGDAPFMIDLDNGVFSDTIAGYVLAEGLCPGTHSLQVIDASLDTLTTVIVVPVDSNYIFVNPFIGSLAIDSLGNTLADCLIDYSSVDTASIAQIVANGNTVNVTWEITNSNGTATLNSQYDLNNGNGVYWLQLSVYCPQRSAEEYFAVTQAIYFDNGAIYTVGNEELLAKEWIIFPNPMQDEVTFSFTANKAQLTVTNVDGKVLIHQQEIVNGTKLSVHDWEAGVYFFECITTNGTFTKTMVK